MVTKITHYARFCLERRGNVALGYHNMLTSKYYWSEAMQAQTFCLKTGARDCGWAIPSGTLGSPSQIPQARALVNPSTPHNHKFQKQASSDFSSRLHSHCYTSIKLSSRFSVYLGLLNQNPCRQVALFLRCGQLYHAHLHSCTLTLKKKKKKKKSYRPLPHTFVSSGRTKLTWIDCFKIVIGLIIGGIDNLPLPNQSCSARELLMDTSKIMDTI